MSEYGRIGARQAGKTAAMKEMIAEAEANGEWVVIASSKGAHCSRCEREAEVCRGSCMESSDTPAST